MPAGTGAAGDASARDWSSAGSRTDPEWRCNSSTVTVLCYVVDSWRLHCARQAPPCACPGMTSLRAGACSTCLRKFRRQWLRCCCAAWWDRLLACSCRVARALAGFETKFSPKCKNSISNSIVFFNLVLILIYSVIWSSILQNLLSTSRVFDAVVIWQVNYLMIWRNARLPVFPSGWGRLRVLLRRHCWDSESDRTCSQACPLGAG